MKIHHISDTHGYHHLLKIDETCDILIHSGDESNSKDRYKNEPECRDFLNWFANQKAKYKIFVPGNHSTAIFHGLITRNDFIARGITYLENEYTYIDDLKIFGSPITPTFSTGWAWNKARNNLDELWSTIDEDTDIVITHGPPKTILDLSPDSTNRLENCGCKSLKRHVLERIKPKFHLFGHIHSNGEIINAGTLQLSGYDTIFSNASVVTDNKFGILTSNGNILTI